MQMKNLARQLADALDQLGALLKRIEDDPDLEFEEFIGRLTEAREARAATMPLQNEIASEWPTNPADAGDLTSFYRVARNALDGLLMAFDVYRVALQLLGRVRTPADNELAGGTVSAAVNLATLSLQMVNFARELAATRLSSADHALAALRVNQLEDAYQRTHAIGEDAGEAFDRLAPK